MGGKKANMAACRARLDEAENQIVKPPECSQDFGFGLSGDNFQEDTHLWRQKLFCGKSIKNPQLDFFCKKYI